MLFTLKEAISKELDRLESEGILQKVSHSDWAAPIVPVLKSDGKIRVCGDFKVTVNPHLEIEKYPFPKPDDLFSSLAGGQRFTKLDLSQAYQQMPLQKNVSSMLRLTPIRACTTTRGYLLVLPLPQPFFKGP